MAPRIVSLNIEIANLDLTDLLAEWKWLVPGDYTPIQMTKFGDCFFVNSAGQVFLLDLIEGNLTQVASSVAEYNHLKDTPDKHAEWFLDGFVFRCDSEGLLLGEGECYAWKVHPIVGGKFEFANIQTFSLNVYQSLLGQLFRQLKRVKPDDPIGKIKNTF
jgi:hypothetical protein